MQMNKDARYDAERNYEVYAEQEWRSKEGLVPLREERPVRVKIEFTKEKQLSRKERKAVYASFNEAPKIGELYSPPRVSEVGKKFGLRGGNHYDLKTGWGLTKEEDRRKMWKELKEDDPYLIVICPPCTAFTMIQELNLPKMNESKALRLIQVGLHYLELAIEVAKWQPRRNKFFVFEQPKEARSWQEECVQELKETEGVLYETLDQCAYGLNVDGRRLNKKPAAILVNSEHLAYRLQRKCSKDHFHVPVMNGLGKKAQEYPPELCRAIVQGIKDQIKEDEDERNPDEEAYALEEGERRGRRNGSHRRKDPRRAGNQRRNGRKRGSQ